MAPRLSIPLNKAYHLINHGPCPVVTTGDGARRDAAPINWTMPVCDDPFMVGIVVEEGNFTDELLKANGEFAVNVVGEPLALQVLALGSSSGRTGDKLAALKLETVPCKTIKPPRLAAAPAHIECRVVDTHKLPGVTLYIGQALEAEVEEDCWDGRHLVLEKIRTIHHVGGGLFAVTDKAKRFR